MAANASSRARRWRRVVGYALLILFLGLATAFVYKFYHHRDLRYCQRGNLNLANGLTNDALAQFRAALKLNPKLMEARVGIVKALARRKEFPDALEEVNKAAENGLSESAAAQLKAGVYSARAINRIETAGNALTVQICEQTITEDLDPAIAMVQEQAGKAEKPADAYTLLGNLYHQKLGIEKAEDALLLKAYKAARDLEKKDEMAARDQDTRALFLKMRSVGELSRQAYEEAIKRNPKAADPRIALAQEALRAYNPQADEAKAILDPLLKLPSPPREALYLTAIAERDSGDLDHALEHLRSVNNVEDPRPEYLEAEAEILIAGGRWPEARAAADKLEKIGPRRPQVRWIMGRVLLHEGRADEALEHLQNIFSSPRTWPQARLTLAQALMSATPPKREQAVSQFSKVLDDCKAATPSNVRMENELRETAYQACAALAGATRELGAKTAQDYAVRALGLAPERPAAFQLAHDIFKANDVAPEKIETLALFHARSLARDPAQRKAAEEFLRKEYEEFKDAPGKGIQVRLLRANILVQMGSYLDAAVIYEGIRKEFPRATVVGYDLAQLHVRLGHYKEAREVYESLLAENPSDVRAVVGLVGVCLLMKDMTGVHAVLDRAATATNSPLVWGKIVYIFMHENRLDEAATLAKAYVEKNPASAPAQCILAEVLWAQGDSKGAKAAFDATLKLEPGFPPAVRCALLDIEEGRAAEAAPPLRAAAEKLHTDSAKTDLAVALQAAGQSKEAGDILKGISASAQGPALQLDAPRWYLAVLSAGEGYLQGAGAMSDLLAAREFLGLPADRLQLLQHVAAAAKPRELAAEINVVLWLSMNSCPGVLEQVDRLMKQLPDEPLVACWRARLLDKAGNHEEATRQCRNILAAHPGFVIARLLLAECQEQSGKTAEAVQSLDASLNEVPPDLVGGLHLQRAQLLAQSGRLDEAIADYHAVTSPPALAAVAGNELAWLYVTRRNDPDSALPAAEQAAKLNPRDPAILDTLGWVFYLKGENDRALECLRRAAAGLPENPTVRYHLGLAFLKIGRKADAKAEFEEALAVSKDFPEAADAAAQLAGI